jgi:hypothetical protein
METWSPITRAEMERLLGKELASCTSDERKAFERIKIPMRAVPILRIGKIESVFALAEFDGTLLIFEDVEQGFEWCEPEADGVIRSYACSQAGLQARLYEVLHKEST